MFTANTWALDSSTVNTGTVGGADVDSGRVVDGMVTVGDHNIYSQWRSLLYNMRNTSIILGIDYCKFIIATGLLIS